MPRGSCDPSPAAHNELTLADDNGRVFITVMWDWDNVSVYPNCDGPVFNGRAVNTSPNTWYAHYQGRNGTPRTVAIPPGTDVTFTRPQMVSRGLKNYSDLYGLSITNSPADPVS